MNPVTNKQEYHNGVDIKANWGTDVIAVFDGVVTEAGEDALSGKYVFYLCDNGYEIRYAHLSYVAVKTGDRISREQVIAKSGATGRVTGAHLHYTLLKNGSVIDPASYVTLEYSQDAKKELEGR